MRRCRLLSYEAKPKSCALSEEQTELQLGEGEPLETNVSTEMEQRLGYDFRDVRVHVGQSATAHARSIGALAYTRGKQIVFGSGRYDPFTLRGRALLAHELTHVIQHAEGRLGSSSTGGSNRALEEEAEAQAASVTLDGGRPSPRRILGHPSRTLPGAYPASTPAAIQMATDEPELQAGIGLGQSIGGVGGGEIASVMACFGSTWPQAILGFLIYRLVRYLRAPPEDQARLLKEFIVNFAIGGPARVLCECLSLVQPAGWLLLKFLELEGPDCAEHYRHYLDGKGGFFEEHHFTTFLMEEPIVRSMLVERIVERLRNNESEAEFRNLISQYSYKSLNWQYSLQSIDLLYFHVVKRDGNRTMVRIGIVDPYEWHPDELFRPALCVHTWSELAKGAGARDFVSVGSALFWLSGESLSPAE